LGIEAVNATLRYHESPVPVAEDALHRAILSPSPRLTLRGHSNSVESVAFSPDGRRLATASRDRTASVWNASTGQKLLSLLHKRSVNGVAFSPDGKRLATASADKAVVWAVATGEELLSLRGHTRVVSSVAFSADGKHIATASEDHTASVWDLAKGEKL